jgi:hypothetical protein
VAEPTSCNGLAEAYCDQPGALPAATAGGSAVGGADIPRVRTSVNYFELTVLDDQNWGVGPSQNLKTTFSLKNIPLYLKNNLGYRV